MEMATATGPAATEPAATEPDSLLAFTVATFLIGLVGVSGNGLVLLVTYRSRRFKKSRLNNAFLINQTCMDLASSVCLVVTFAYKMTPVRLMWGTAGLVQCILLEGEGLLWTFLSASALSLMALTFERYMKIVFPVKHHNSFGIHTKAALIALSWIFPVVWLMPFLTISSAVSDGYCLFQGAWPNDLLAGFYGWTYVMLFYFVPLLMFLYSYSHMLWTLSKRHSQVTDGTTNQSTGTVSRAQVNVIKTMLIVSCCFAILWAPAQLYYFSFIIEVYTGEYLSPAYYAFNIICFINSVINPFIYVVKLTEFRASLFSMFCCGGQSEAQTTESGSHTGNTLTAHSSS